jgi:hypothetical protein
MIKINSPKKGIKTLQKRFFYKFFILAIFCILCACSAKPAVDQQTTTSADSAYPAENGTNSAASETTSNENVYPAPPTGVVLQFIRPDGSALAFTSDQITKLPSGKLTIDSKTVEGPAISEIIKAAGVTTFETITIGGPSGSVSIKKSQVNDKVLITLSAEGTATAYVASAGDKAWTGVVYVISAH